jgi:hypothetical protein
MQGTVLRDSRAPEPAMTSERLRRAAPTIAAPMHWVARLDGPPNVVRGELHTATAVLLEAAVEPALARCAETASHDVALEADVTLVDGTTTEADVLADPRAVACATRSRRAT